MMFYEEDLIESSVDVTDASVYSGICTEIFKQGSVIRQRNVYSFIHLSVQEFFAAFYLLYCHLINNKEPLHEFRFYRFNKDSLYDLLRSAVINSLQSENGHLDLFLQVPAGRLTGVQSETLTGSTDTHREQLREHQRNHTVH